MNTEIFIFLNNVTGFPKYANATLIQNKCDCCYFWSCAAFAALEYQFTAAMNAR